MAKTQKNTPKQKKSTKKPEITHEKFEKLVLDRFRTVRRFILCAKCKSSMIQLENTVPARFKCSGSRLAQDQVSCCEVTWPAMGMLLEVIKPEVTFKDEIDALIYTPSEYNEDLEWSDYDEDTPMEVLDPLTHPKRPIFENTQDQQGSQSTTRTSQNTQGHGSETARVSSSLSSLRDQHQATHVGSSPAQQGVSSGQSSLTIRPHRPIRPQREVTSTSDAPIASRPASHEEPIPKNPASSKNQITNKPGQLLAKFFGSQDPPQAPSSGSRGVADSQVTRPQLLTKPPEMTSELVHQAPTQEFLTRLAQDLNANHRATQELISLAKSQDQRLSKLERIVGTLIQSDNSQIQRPPLVTKPLIGANSTSRRDPRGDPGQGSSSWPFPQGRPFTTNTPTEAPRAPITEQLLDDSDIASAITAITKKSLPREVLMSNHPDAISQADHLVRVYVKGLNLKSKINQDGHTLGQLRSYLFTLRFRLSRIVNIASAGGDFTEFIVFDDYRDMFIETCRGYGLLVSTTYNPLEPMNPRATEVVKERIMKTFVTRLRRSFERTESPLMREYYRNWLHDVGFAAPDEATSIVPTEDPEQQRTETNQLEVPQESFTHRSGEDQQVNDCSAGGEEQEVSSKAMSEDGTAEERIIKERALKGKGKAQESEDEDTQGRGRSSLSADPNCGSADQ